MRYPPAGEQELRAPKSQFRAIGMDVKEGSGTTYLVGDFASLDAAQTIASERAGVGTPIYIYNDSGEVVLRFGSWH